MNGDDTQEPDSEQEPIERPKKRRWRERDSVRSLRREAASAAEEWAEFDQRDNDESRLPPGEEVHLGGVALAEVFTPTTISALYDALAETSGQQGKKEERFAALTTGRSAGGAGGWQSLGVIRRPGEFGLDSADPDLPVAVEAVWPYLYFVTPSLTILVATFTLTDQAGDLSDLLRADYRGESTDIHLQVQGRFGWIRARIPWARPRLHRIRWTQRRALEQKQRACESLITTHEEACWKWFARRFPGRFSTEAIVDRPTVRILLTTEHVPFKDRHEWFAPVGLQFASTVWTSAEPSGWAFTSSAWPRQRRFTAISAARRSDAAKSQGMGMSGDTIWHLTQQFARHQSTLVARWAMTCLLRLYADRLASVRDQAGRRLRIARPVRAARDLDGFLIGDGLDASTIVSDLEDFTHDLGGFRLDAPQYIEDLSEYPEAARERYQPQELVGVLRDTLQDQAGRLQRDMAATTANMTASAELRQAIANTIVQRRLLGLTLVAIAIAIVSLVVAIQAGH